MIVLMSIIHGLKCTINPYQMPMATITLFFQENYI